MSVRPGVDEDAERLPGGEGAARDLRQALDRPPAIPGGGAGSSQDDAASLRVQVRDALLGEGVDADQEPGVETVERAPDGHGVPPGLYPADEGVLVERSLSGGRDFRREDDTGDLQVCDPDPGGAAIFGLGADRGCRILPHELLLSGRQRGPGAPNSRSSVRSAFGNPFGGGLLLFSGGGPRQRESGSLRVHLTDASSTPLFPLLRSRQRKGTGPRGPTPVCT